MVPSDGTQGHRYHSVKLHPMKVIEHVKVYVLEATINKDHSRSPWPQKMFTTLVWNDQKAFFAAPVVLCVCQIWV